MRKICYVTGSRADFGLMHSTLKKISNDQRLSLTLCVTGQHLSSDFGNTVKDVEDSGLDISVRIPVALNSVDGLQMLHAIGAELIGMADYFAAYRPDLVLVLGDRGEMLAAAIAALHLNIPVVHLHGGELSGTVDEPVRHAISKLSHYHFTSTEKARERLICMGEEPSHIFVTGAPGLDELKTVENVDREDLAAQLGLDSSRPIALMLFHPVLQEREVAGNQADEIVKALRQKKCQALCLMPNSDAGGAEIRKILTAASVDIDIKVVDHLPRESFIAWMMIADFMIGNSSSGIIEAASFNLPVINVGNRQFGRERSGNVSDVLPIASEISRQIDSTLQTGKVKNVNVYGDGMAGSRIAELLVTLPINEKLMQKQNTY